MHLHCQIAYQSGPLPASVSLITHLACVLVCSQTACYGHI